MPNEPERFFFLKETFGLKLIRFEVNWKTPVGRTGFGVWNILIHASVGDEWLNVVCMVVPDGVSG